MPLPLVLRAWARSGHAVAMLVTALALAWATPALAQPIPPGAVPPELRPWIPWVLDELGHEACTQVGAERVCDWPGRLAVAATPTGATFVLVGLAERRTRVELPGDKLAWPRAVEVGGVPGVVLDAEGKPGVEVPAGPFEIKGRFAWPELPRTLAVPTSVAVVRLERGGVDADQVRRGADGALWLSGEPEAAQPEPPPDTNEAERLELEVFRRIDDGVPLVVTTHVVLRVGGRSRELDVSGALLEGGTLLDVDTRGLGARLRDGKLSVELQRGPHELTLRQRFAAPPDVLALGARTAPWPDREIWVWAPDTAQRQVEVSGASGIDPSRTNVPADWRQFRAFVVKPGGALRFETLRRGEPEPPPTELHLDRTAWLDLDGGGFTVVDVLTGAMHRGWRLTFAGGTLGSAGVDREPQLITVDPVTGEPGLELRRSRLDVGVVYRLEGNTGRLPAAGWSEPAQSTSLRVNLPPGWELLAVSGADQHSDTWLTSWSIAEGVVVLLVAVAVGWLAHPLWGLVALCLLVLGHDAAPALRYAWLPLLVVLALVRTLPEGRVRRGLARARWVALAVPVAVVGAVALRDLGAIAYRSAGVAPVIAQAELELEEKETEQIRDTRADNKEGGTGARAKGEEGGMGRLASAKGNRYGVQGPAGLLGIGAGGDPDAPTAEWGRDDGSTPPAAPPIDPDAVIQTGPAMPRWQWSSFVLTWDAPVARDHAVRLWLASPVVGAAIKLGRLLFAAALCFALVRFGNRLARRPGGGAGARRAGAAGAAAVALGLALFAPSRALGQDPAGAPGSLPSRQLLDDLKARLARAPACAPSCVTAPRMTLRASPKGLALEAEVHVGAVADFVLPGPASAWVPRVVEVDGEPARALRAFDDGALHLRLAPGVHQVKLAGPIAAMTLAFGTVPHEVAVEAEGFLVEGVEDGRVSGPVRISPVGADQPQEPPPGPDVPPGTADLEVPPWLVVTRTFDIGVRWTVETRLVRASRLGAPILVR
ncbi:MAG: hypothetical protein IT373_35645, partial [Polyangiaceae bacterium]|nr:hypothetical protein [Polyangiaceae bacterium]